MEKYIPDMYQQSIYTIDYKKLANRGIKCILFDLDNTLVPSNVRDINPKLKELIDDLKELGFKVIIFSNSHGRRVKVFKEKLDVDAYWLVFKPRAKKFNLVLDSNKYKQTEVAIIGDQLFTDIVGGNRVGITTILINPMSKRECVFTKFNRMKEYLIMKRLRNKNLFVKGRYYE